MGDQVDVPEVAHRQGGWAGQDAAVAIRYRPAAGIVARPWAGTSVLPVHVDQDQRFGIWLMHVDDSPERPWGLKVVRHQFGSDGLGRLDGRQGPFHHLVVRPVIDMPRVRLEERRHRAGDVCDDHRRHQTRELPVGSHQACLSTCEKEERLVSGSEKYNKVLAPTRTRGPIVGGLQPYLRSNNRPSSPLRLHASPPCRPCREGARPKK